MSEARGQKNYTRRNRLSSRAAYDIFLPISVEKAAFEWMQWRVQNWLFLINWRTITLKMMVQYDYERMSPPWKKKDLEKNVGKQNFWKKIITQSVRHYFCLANIPRQKERVITFTGSKKGYYSLGSNEKVCACALGIDLKNRQFRARIARKECGHINEVGRKRFFFNASYFKYRGNLEIKKFN